MKLQIKKATTSKLIEVFIQDSSQTDGRGLTGLTFESAGISAYYYRSGAAAGGQAISLVTMTCGTWASGGFVAVDGTNLPGVYQLGLPNAALLTGAEQVIVMLKGAANMAPVVLEIQLLDNLPGEIASGQSIQTVTDPVTVGTVSDKTGYSLDTSEHTSIADAVLKRDWTAVTGEAARSVLNALRFLRNKWSVSGTTLTVTKENDSSTAWTGVLTENADANPITGCDPS